MYSNYKLQIDGSVTSTYVSQSLTGRYLFNPQTTPSKTLIYCSKQCLTQTGCESFAYSVSTKLCYWSLTVSLYKSLYTEQGYDYVYDKRRFIQLFLRLY